LDSVNKLKQNQHCTFSYSTCPALVKGVECCIPGVAVTYRHSSIAIWGRIITVGCRNTRSKYIAGWKQIITQAFIYLLHTVLWKCCRLWTDTIHTYMSYISYVMRIPTNKTARKCCNARPRVFGILTIQIYFKTVWYIIVCCGSPMTITISMLHTYLCILLNWIN